MRPEEYEKLAAVEDRMWWFHGAHTNMLTAFRRTTPPAGPVLDAGCGAGGFAARLADALPGRSVVGLDYDPHACALARRRSGIPVCRASVERLPFADGAFAAIFSADVLCHAEVGEASALSEFHRCLATGGTLVLNLPAYPWLMSAHDRAVDNVRRYSRTGLLDMLRRAGFDGGRAGYWNTVLFPLMLLKRKLLPGGSSDVKLLPGPLEAGFRWIMRLEAGYLRRGHDLPFGGSLLAVAVKHG